MSGEGQGIDADDEVMGAVAGKAMGIVGQLRTTATTLEAQLEAVLGSGWIGAGGNAFNVAHAGLQRDMTMINNALNRLSGLIGEAAGNYRSGDDASDEAVRTAAAAAGTGEITSALKGLAS